MSCATLQPASPAVYWVEVSLKMCPAITIGKTHKAFPRIPASSMPRPLGCLTPKLLISAGLSFVFSIPTTFMSEKKFWSYVDHAKRSASFHSNGKFGRYRYLFDEHH